MLPSWIEPEYSSVMPEMLLLFGLARPISSIGFYRVLYPISIGCAFSMVAMAVDHPLQAH